MFKRIRKTDHKCRQAFTLVELIIVLVILAILAAIIVPALTGYIKKSKKAQYIQMADSYRTAAQAVMTEFYGTTKGHNWPQAQNVYWDEGDGKKWGDKVLQLVGGGRGADNNEPYILVIAVGDPRDNTIKSTQQYTVYYVGYVASEKSPAVFYVNGDWIYTYPTENPQYIKKTGQNENIRNRIIKPAGTNIPIQYFVISNRSGLAHEGNNNFWLTGTKSLKGHSEPHFKG